MEEHFNAMYDTLAFVIVFALVAEGTILRVPSDALTIQTALNLIEDQDTILVSSGRYDEALIAPPISFTLLGESSPDSSLMTGSVIDIGHLANAESLRCLTLSEGLVVLESLLFRNSIGAYDTSRMGMGGILAGSAHLVVKDCLFDSVAGSIEEGAELVVMNCSFYNIQGTALFVGYTPIRAQNSVFSGRGFWQVACGGNAKFTNCVFERNDRGHFLSTYGDSIVIDGCTFRDYGPYPFVPVTMTAGRGCAIRNCTFTNINIGRAVVEVFMFCDSLEGSQLEISNVVFDGYQGGFGQGGEALAVHCDWDHPYEEGFPIAISNCEFRDGHVIETATIALRADMPIEVDSCVFADLEPLNLPACLQDAPQGAVHATYHNCAFDSSLIAIIAGDSVDARWNWWGDSSGPTDLVGNPSGIGAEIRGPVLYVPWLTAHPDSTDTTNISIDDGHFVLHPSSYTLTAYPNPFNAVTTLQIDVERVGEYEVKLFNVTGREVAVLFSGRVESQTEVKVNASGLASGVYFAALQNRDANVAVSKLLLLK